MAVHATIAELNQYIISFAATTNPVTHKKMSHSIQLRQLYYDNLVIPSSEIHSIKVSFPGTLQHTDFYNRGNRSFITDKCYLVFINLEQCIENLLQKSFLLQSGRFVTDAVEELHSNQALKQSFIDLFHEEDISNYVEGQTENNAVSSNNIVIVLCNLIRQL